VRKYLMPGLYIMYIFMAGGIWGCAGNKSNIKNNNQVITALENSKAQQEQTISGQLVPEYRIGPGDMIRVSYFKKYGGTKDYILTAGDTISVSIEGHPEWSVSSTINPDGKISLYQIGRLQAAGLNYSEFYKLLYDQYSKLISEPQVNIFFNECQADLTDFLSMLAKSPEGSSASVLVRLDGNISLPLIDQINLRGLTISQATNQIKEEYNKLLDGLDITLNVKSNNSKYIAVLGEVKKPGVFSLGFPLTSTQAVAMSEGFLDTANLDNIILVRRSSNEYLIINFNEIFKKGAIAKDITLAPDDILFVPKKGIAVADLFIDQYIRKLLPVSLGSGVYYQLNNNN
jgi:polysaccharide export outer membrane protein